MSVPYKGMYISDKDRYHEDHTHNSVTANKVFFLQKDEPVFLADSKYIYENTEIQTKINGERDYKIFYFDQLTNKAEYYEIVSSVSDYVFGKSFLIYF